jgi:hypothetical protein
MSFLSLPTKTIHHILSYNGTTKLRNGKLIGQIPPTDERYELLLKIPKMLQKHPDLPFVPDGHMTFIFHVIFTHKDHYIGLFINHYNSPICMVKVVYRNRRQGLYIDYFRE